MLQDKYGHLCNQLYQSDKAIVGVAMIINDKQIVYKTSDSFPIPDEKDRLMHMLKQAYILVNEPASNEDYFGKVKYVMVHHETYDMFLFRVDSDSLKILVVAATPGEYDHNKLVGKVSREFLDK
jgi:hypothetical protein